MVIENIINNLKRRIAAIIPQLINDDVESVSSTYSSNKITELLSTVDGGLVGTKQVDESAIDNDMILLYKTASGKLEYEAKPAGGGDMLLNEVQNVTALKKFDKDTIAMKGTSTGVNTISVANTSATSYVNELPAKAGTFAMTSDVIALGETSATAYRGDRGKKAYDHSQETHAPSDADNTEKAIMDAAVTESITDSDLITLLLDNGLVTVTFENLKKALKDYFDRFYAPLE